MKTERHRLVSRINIKYNWEQASRLLEKKKRKNLYKMLKQKDKKIFKKVYLWINFLINKVLFLKKNKKINFKNYKRQVQI